jgi:hypothetical protein
MTDDCIVISKDQEQYIPPVGKQNGYMAGNNVWGKGNFVNGVDFTQSLKIQPDTFPGNTDIRWSWPDAAGPEWPYGYPELIYGYTGDNNSGFPAPIQIKNLQELTVTYDVTPDGNLNSYDVLIDMFPTVEQYGSPFTNSGNAEVSFYPFWEAPVQNKGVVHVFTKSDPPFKAQVFSQKSTDAETGSYTIEVIIRPIEDNPAPFYDAVMGFFAKWGIFTKVPRKLLKAKIDMKEVYEFLVSQGILSGDLYVQNVQLGVEPQCPNQYNTPPHQGSLYVWQFDVSMS